MNDADIALAYFEAEVVPGLQEVGVTDDQIGYLRRHWLDGVLVRTHAMAEIQKWAAERAELEQS